MKRKRTAIGFLSLLLPFAVVTLNSCSRAQRTPSPEVYRQVSKTFREGGLDEALRLLEPHRAYLEKDPSIEAGRLRLLKVDVLLAQAKYDEAAYLLAKSLPANTELSVRSGLRWADLLMKLNRPQAALAQLEEAERNAAKLEDPAWSGRANNLHGIFLARMGNVAPGEELLLKSRDSALARHDDYDLTTTLVNLALLYSKVGRFDECIRYGQLGAEAGERVHARRSISAAYGNTSECMAALGDVDAAQQLNDNAVRIQTQLGDSRMLSQSLGRMGTSRLMRRDAPEAVKNYLQAYQLARTVAPDDASVWAVNLSVAYLLIQNVEEAERWNDEARRMKAAAGDENSMVFAD